MKTSMKCVLYRRERRVNQDGSTSFDRVPMAVTVWLELDLETIAQDLGQKALHNKGGKARAMHKAVTAWIA